MNRGTTVRNGACSLLVILLSTLSSHAQSRGVIITVAGIGTSGNSGDGGPATSAQISYPLAVAVDAADNLYIAEGNRIRKITARGMISTVAGTGESGYSGDGGPATAAALFIPQGLALDSVGNLYIADGGNSRIRKVTPSGIISTVVADLGFYLRVALDSAGNLYVADGLNDRILKVTPNGFMSRVAGTGVKGFSGDGGSATAAQLNSPTGIALDSTGNLYIADQVNDRVRKVTPDGIITTVAGTGTAGYSGDGGPAIAAQLHHPTEVVLDAAGSLYFSEHNTFVGAQVNDRVRKVTPNGIITTFAGTGSSGFSGDGGPAISATLNDPAGVAVDLAGNLYIADRMNNRVRKVIANDTSPTAASYHVFPQFADGRFSDGTYYRTTLMISTSSSSVGTTCRLQLRGLILPGFTSTYTLGASGWVIAPTSGTQNFQSGYATLQCSAGVEAQLLYSFYSANGTKISEATVFPSPPGAIVKILADESEGAQVGLAIANDSDQRATYTISVGNAPATATVTLGPRTSTAKFLNQFISGIPANNVAQVTVSSTNGTASIIGLRFTGGVFTTLPSSMRNSVGATASTYHVFPQFADGRFNDGSYYRTTRMYVNPHLSATADCTTRLRGTTTDGFDKFTASLAPGSFVIAPTNGTQTFQSGYATLECSASVDATALYSYYSANGVKLSEATVFSSPAAQSVQILADSREGARLGIAIANDSDLIHTYTIEMRDATGNTVGSKSIVLPGRTSVADFVDNLVPVPPNHVGAVIVASTTGKASVVGLRFTGTAFTTLPATIR